MILKNPIIDRVFLLITLNNPPTTFNFIDRFLVTAEAYRIETILVFNKIDTFDQATADEQLYMQYVYQKIGYQIIENYGQYAGVENSVCMQKIFRP